MSGTFLPDESAMLQFAARMARHLPPDAAPLVVYLHGDLGAGKTTLARGLLRELGEAGPVRSPTYGLVAEYLVPAGRVMHLDLYRLNDAEELLALGLGDYLAGSRLWLIEWPERGARGGLPAADAHVWIDVEGVGRRVRVAPHSPLGERWVTAMSADER